MAVTVQEKTICGFCQSGRHGDGDGGCSIATKHRGRHEKYPHGVVWACSCREVECATRSRRKCADCGNKVEAEVNPETYICFDVDACQALIEERRENNPFTAQLREIQERVKMAKIENDEAKAKTKTPKTGTCVCGCNGTTKGGKFLPGHDARFVSTLVATVAEAKFTKKADDAARKSLKDVGASDALQNKYGKSVALAKEKADKREQAAKDKAAAKAEANA